ncbi:MAG: hypothetical protein WC563_15680 [Brevundimonas sp.]
MSQYADISLTNDGDDSVVVMMYSTAGVTKGLGVLADTVAGKPRSCCLPTGAGGCARSIGVAVDTIDALGTGRVCIHGPAVMLAHAALHTGDFAEISDTAGHLGEAIDAVVAAGTATHPCLGQVLQASTADNDYIEVFVNPTNLPKAAA